MMARFFYYAIPYTFLVPRHSYIYCHLFRIIKYRRRRRRNHISLYICTIIAFSFFGNVEHLSYFWIYNVCVYVSEWAAAEKAGSRSLQGRMLQSLCVLYAYMWAQRNQLVSIQYRKQHRWNFRKIDAEKEKVSRYQFYVWFFRLLYVYRTTLKYFCVGIGRSNTQRN